MKTMYRFGFGTAEGDGSMKELLGGKGAGLANMAKLGLPVPPGVTIPTDQCAAYEASTDSAEFCLAHAIAVLEAYEEFVVPEMGFMPLLSVRSGARVSMPGMMDTILNVGITTKNLPEWSERIGPRAAQDSYRRLIQMYASTVDGIPGELFEHALTTYREAQEYASDTDLTADDLCHVVGEFKSIYTEYAGVPFPDTLEQQLMGCIGAVFASWNSERAIEYRTAHQIPGDWGTAVTVQSMVFGNLNDKSATGVLFTRDPNTGEPGLFGEFLINAQGEDVVAGIRTPEPLQAMAKWNKKVHTELTKVALGMEKTANDMQDMEFTVQDGKLFILQTRNGKRSARAAFRIALDMVNEGRIEMADALKRVTGKQYMALLRPSIPAGFNVAPTYTGIPGGGSVVSGVAVLTSEDAKASKVPCILVREETTPDDFPGMMAAVGILTRTGGATSHAAVVARGMDKPCVVGVTDMTMGIIGKVKAGTKVTIDGSTGRVWVGVEVPVQQGEVTPEAAEILAFARAYCGSSAPRSITLTASNWEAQLPASGEVQLDISDLANHPRCRRLTRHLFEALQARKDLRGVISYAPCTTGAVPDSSLLLAGLGLMDATESAKPALFPAEQVDKLADTVAQKKWTKAFKSRWVMRVEGDLRPIADEHGWAVEFSVNTLAELFAAPGPVAVSAGLQEVLKAQGLTVAHAINHLKDAQPNLKVLPEGVDGDTEVFALLG